jgi:signal transduction histidine kinase
MYVDDVFGPLYIIYSLYILIQLTLAIIITIKKIVKFKGIDKKKTTIALIGLSLFGISAAVVNAILPAFDIYIFYKKTILLSLFFLLPTFYSFQRYRFFNISYISLNVLRNIILISLFVLSITVSNSVFTLLLPNISDVIILIVSSILALVIWLYIQKTFPKLIIGGFLKLKKIIDKLQSSLYLCDKYEDLRNKIEKHFILDFNITSAKIYAVRKEEIKNHLPIYKRDEFTKELGNIKNDALVLEEIKYKKISSKTKDLLIKKLRELDAILCIPLFIDRKLIGFFTLGNKEKNKLYSKEEVTEILKLKPYLEICLMNFLLKLNLQEENDLMKEIIEKKTERLREQFQEIKSILKQQSDFIAVTAHEFRTPLSIALFQLEDTLYSHKHDPGVVKDMEVMGQSLNNLKDLTQKLFDVQQYDLDKVKLRKEKTSLKKFLNKIYEDFKLFMKEKKIHFRLEDHTKKDLEIDIDKAQLRQVIINLLTNAIKFVDKKTPKIELGIEETNNKIRIYITDNGKGIQDNDKKRVFEKFKTTDQTKATGIGLGLYICKKVVNLHEGKIWVENSKSGGAKFIIEL